MNLQQTWRYVYSTFPGRLGREDCLPKCTGSHTCCRPGQALILMPGEAEYLIGMGVDGVEDESWTCPGRDGCLGQLRPMCCRTFPLHPNDNGELLAYRDCSQHKWTSQRFIRDVKRAWSRLLGFQEISAWCWWARQVHWSTWPETPVDAMDRGYDDGYTLNFGKYHQVTARKEMVAARATYPGERVLDVGCAAGTGVAELREQGVEAYGVDINPAFSGEHCQTADARKLPFPDNHFDAAICIDLLEHLPDYRLALEEMVRVTTKRLLLSVTPLENAVNFYDDPTHCVPMRWPEWRAEFERYGEIVSSSTYPWAALVELNGGGDAA